MVVEETDWSGEKYNELGLGVYMTGQELTERAGQVSDVIEDQRNGYQIHCRIEQVFEVNQSGAQQSIVDPLLSGQTFSKFVVQ